MAADLRAPTPTGAAELIAAQRAAALQRLDGALRQIHGVFLGRVEMSRLRLEALQARTPLAHPQWLVENRRQRLDDLNGRLLRAREVCLTRLRHRLALAAGKLDSLSPLATLARGYATVSKLPGESPVTRADEVRAGDRVRIRLAGGAFDSEVLRVEPITPDGEEKDGSPGHGA
jgi:exodeoxyribonuclease VII large subunit